MGVVSLVGVLVEVVSQHGGSIGGSSFTGEEYWWE